MVLEYKIVHWNEDWDYVLCCWVNKLRNGTSNGNENRFSWTQVCSVVLSDVIMMQLGRAPQNILVYKSQKANIFIY